MVFFLVDLDAFFASVEIRDDPSLAGKPVIVGALPGHRGVVSACSYEARKFGVRSAMPISQAHRRCPQGVYLTPRMERYSELSGEVMSILGQYTPELQRISIDEAFLDMSGTERLLGPPLEVGPQDQGARALRDGPGHLHRHRAQQVPGQARLGGRQARRPARRCCPGGRSTFWTACRWPSSGASARRPACACRS